MSLSELEKLQLENKALREELAQCTLSISRLNNIDNVYEWTWEVDAEGIYTYVSDNVTAVIGHAPQDLIGKSPFDFMSKDEAKRVENIFIEVATQEKPFSKLFNICMHKDGSTVYIETSGEPIYNHNGDFCGYRGIDFDRTLEYKKNKYLEEKNRSLTEALHAQHELLLNVTNSISDLIFYKDTEFKYIGCNQAFSNFVGLPVDYIIGKTDYELFAKEYADLFRSMDKRVIKNLEEHSNYEWVSHADGRKLYLLTKKAPLVDTKSKLIGMVGIAKDLSNEYELERQLKQSNNFLIDAQSIAKIGHWDWDILAGKLVWSDEIYRIFGYKPQEFGATYEAFLQTIHPDDRQMVEDAVQEAVENNDDYDIFHRIVLPTGEEKFVHEIGHAIYDKDKTPIRMIGTVQDVTTLHRVQNELSQQKDAFESIFEYSSDGTILLDKGKFIACNQAVVEMIRASSKEDILNMHPSQLSPEFQPDGRSSFEKAEEMLQICLRDGRKQFEWLHIRQNGQEFWAEVLLTRLEINNRPITHASLRDISERKKLDNALERSNMNYQKLASELDIKVKEQSAQMIKQSRMAQMGELLSMIAHQWRQPLSSIAAIASAIQIKISLASDDVLDEGYSQYLNSQMEDIGSFTQSLSNTIDDFRTLYKPDKIMKYSHLHDPIDRALKLLEMSFSKDKIRIEKDYTTTLCLLMHENEVMQVLLNILKNAEDNFIEKNIKDPLITIRTSIGDFSANILVCDNGGGIKDDVINKIFDPYFSTKGEKNGTGLGLYMSKIIIEQHHQGSLSAYNTDEGTCFNVELAIQ